MARKKEPEFSVGIEVGLWIDVELPANVTNMEDALAKAKELVSNHKTICDITRKAMNNQNIGVVDSFGQVVGVHRIGLKMYS